MRKTISMLVACMVATSAIAKGSSAIQNDDYQAVGIVTVNVATTVFRTERVAHDDTGNLMVCPWQSSTGREISFNYRAATCLESSTDKNSWVYPQNMPRFSTKQYVGFRITNSGLYEFYYK